MLHPHNTRASRRALAAASTVSAVRSRRPLLLLGTAAGALLGITLTVGLVSAPAAGAAQAGAADAAAAKATSAPLLKLPDEIAQATTAAKDAVATADALTAEVSAAGLDLGETAPVVDTTELQGIVEDLAERASTPAVELTLLAVAAEQRTDEVVSETATLQAAFTAAQEQKAAEDAAAAAAEQAAAEAAALANANTVDGAKATAQAMAASEYGWGADQFSCLSSLWQKESSWNYQAYNPSGATGIPQALPGSKMASAGSDWQTSAATQIAWGLGYISSVYGTPCSAWSHSQSSNWY
ncbi:phospholipase [Microbacterium sp. NPDC087665]|uniref:aggregation-promoting factor C-terminal-like domain-containing protein n=1 Tax=Microbacterium sp. NPDC087665 TaxID=3364194 RepID=UPI0037FFB41D